MVATETMPVEDSVPKINDEVAVGEDLEFQKRWWRFEKGIWLFFTVLVILDLLGAFGRGPLAKAQAQARDGAMTVKYERVQRFSTPSILGINFSQEAIHNGKVQLWVSESLVEKLGNQRIVPQPTESVIGKGGILYTFTATTVPAAVQFAFSPASPGIAELKLQVPGSDPVLLKVFVVP